MQSGERTITTIFGPTSTVKAAQESLKRKTVKMDEFFVVLGTELDSVIEKCS